LDASEATRMTEKGSPILLILILGLLYWASIPSTVPDPTQCDLMDSAPMIEELATVKESFTVQPDHIPDATKMIDSAPMIEEVAKAKDSMILDAAKDAAVSVSLARSLAENHIVDANKKADPQPSPSDKPYEAVKREILVFLAPKDQKCEPCDRWKRCEMQRFMDAKWEVAIFDEPHNYGRTPTFELKSGDKKATLTGYTTLEQAAEAVR
jgi:hypothetical protein